MSTLRINGDWNSTAVLKADGSTQHTDFLRSPFQRYDAQGGFVSRSFSVWYTPTTDVVISHSHYGASGSYSYIDWYLSPDGGTTLYGMYSYTYFPGGYSGAEMIFCKAGWSYKFNLNYGSSGQLREYTLMG